jgi:hypothetical protein
MTKNKLWISGVAVPVADCDHAVGIVFSRHCECRTFRASSGGENR